MRYEVRDHYTHRCYRLDDKRRAHALASALRRNHGSHSAISVVCIRRADDNEDSPQSLRF